MGNPVKILVTVGALNGLILPIALAIILLAAYKKKTGKKLPASALVNHYWLDSSWRYDHHEWRYHLQMA